MSKPKPKPKPTKPHKREPRKPFQNGCAGYVSPAAKEFAHWMYQAINTGVFDASRFTKGQ